MIKFRGKINLRHGVLEGSTEVRGKKDLTCYTRDRPSRTSQLGGNKQRNRSGTQSAGLMNCVWVKLKTSNSNSVSEAEKVAGSQM